MWFLIALLWLAMVIGIFWAYGSKRRRTSGARDKELAALMAEAKLVARSAQDAQQQPVATASVAPAPAVVAAITVSRKPRLLGQSDALLYLLFRTGLPDHEVFANLTLADVVEPLPALQGYDREQLLRRLALHRLNLVICTKQLGIVAAVLLGTGSSALAAEQEKFITASLDAAGITLLRIDPTALPRHQQVRALVYGNAPVVGTARQ